MTDPVSEAFTTAQSLASAWNSYCPWRIEQDPDSIYMRCLSFTPSYGLSTLEHTNNLLEALELLALVKVVDPVGWVRRMGSEHPSRHFGRCIPDRQFPVFVIDLGSGVSVEAIESTLSLVMAPANDRDYSQRFLDAKAAVLAITDDPDIHTAICDMRIPVRIVDSDGRAEVADVFQRVMQRSGENNGSMFTLTGIGLDRINLTPVVVEKLHRYVHSPLSLDRVYLSLHEGDAEASPLTRLEVGQCVLDVLGRNGAAHIECPRVDRRLLLEATMSAFASPEPMRLRSLEFGMGSRFDVAGDSPGERCSRWLWLLCGLFSQDAHHSIRSISFWTFDGVKPQELEWLDDLLQTQAAPRMELLIPEVFDEYLSREPPTTDRWVMAPRGYPIRLEERDDWQTHALRFDDEDMSFRVIRDDPARDSIDILVPGYGRCWVERSETLTIVDKPLTPWRFDQHTVQSLDIAYELGLDDEQHAIGVLLRLVGAPLKTLRIHSIRTRFGDPSGLKEDLLTTIVRSCPQLERLILSGVTPVDVDAFLQAFEHPHVSLPVLVFESQPLIFGWCSWKFVNALCDPTLAINQKLQQLAIDFIHYKDDPNYIYISPEEFEYRFGHLNLSFRDLDVDDAVADILGLDVDGRSCDVEAMLRMLETTSSLSVVHVGLSPRLQARYGEEFRALGERFTACQSRPMSMRAKCALLSTMGVGMPLEDTVLLSHVFAFAAECEARVVTTGTPSPRPRFTSGI